MSLSAKLSKIIATAKRRRFLTVVVCIAAAVTVVGIVQLLVLVSHTTGTAQPPDVHQTITVDTDSPSEKKSPDDAYIVPADQPRMIHMPSIEASGPIQKVGVTKSNAIAVPTNVNFAGWYTKSAKPGYPGLSVIDGHVSGKYKPGIFKQLQKLNKGDTYEVEYGDNSRRTFRVVERKKLPTKEASSYLLDKRSDIERQLNLITCDGVYDRETKQYDQRLIVISEAIDQ